MAGQQQPPFTHLTDILFEKDRAVRQEIADEVQSLETELRDPEAVRSRVTPYIEENMEHLRENFPEEFGPVITQTIKKQISEAQDEVIEALYPILGKLVRKYIVREIEKLSERIDQQVDNAFSWESWKNRFKSWFTGVPEEDLIIRDLAPPRLEEAFVVEKESGLLLGAWSSSEDVADRDMVAGMLTAIKSFVEDAFARNPESLELIEYETYKILIHNFPKFYIAAVISGAIHAEYKDELADQMLDVGAALGTWEELEITEDSQDEVRDLLKNQFDLEETE